MGYIPYLVEEKEDPGGMLNNNRYNNNSVLCEPTTTNEALRKKMVSHILSSRTKIFTHTKITKIKPVFSGHGVEFSVNSAGKHANAINSTKFNRIVIATGTRVRGKTWLLNKIGEASSSADIIRNAYIGPLSMQDELDNLANFQDNNYLRKRWLVVGGGANAVDVACRLSEHKEHIILCARSDWKGCPPNLLNSLNKLQRKRSINIINPCTITEVNIASDAGHLLSISTADKGRLLVDKIVIMFGFQPNSDEILILPKNINVGIDGCYLTDKKFSTDFPGIFAIGDVSNNGAHCISSAMGAGAVAAKNILFLSSHDG
jgi:thioredoxin reductase